MQLNNKMRVFSGDTTNIIATSDLDSERVTKGAVLETKADSALYNSLSLSTTKITTALADFIAQQNPDTDIAQETSLSDMISYIKNTFMSKKDIEERLSALGFKQGGVILNNGNTAIINSLKRQGNYIIGNLEVTFSAENMRLDSINRVTTGFLGTCPENFRPKETLNFVLESQISKTTTLTITTSGLVSISFNDLFAITSFSAKALNFGYEAPPISV